MHIYSKMKGIKWKFSPKLGEKVENFSEKGNLLHRRVVLAKEIVTYVQPVMQK